VSEKEHTETEPAITGTEVAILNAARAILRERTKYSYPANNDTVRVAVTAEHAEYAIFQYLCTGDAYLDWHLTPEQLHNEQAMRDAREEARS
jgi:hypothetical protein